MISETWHQDPSKEIFVDRNGPRFQYVLDYMRDQKAHLAMGFSRASIFKELEYFGFENVPIDALDVSGANLTAAEHLIMAKEAFKETIKKKDHEKCAAIFANKCFMKYINTCSLDVSFEIPGGPFLEDPLPFSCPPEYVNEQLAIYGLSLVSSKYNSYTDCHEISLGKLTKNDT